MQYLDRIIEAVVLVGNALGRVQGAKKDIIKLRKRDKQFEFVYEKRDDQEVPYLDEAIRALGGKGTVIERT